jgi:hypothetical protein
MKDLRIQLDRIAQMQVQLDKVMSIVTSGVVKT